MFTLICTVARTALDTSKTSR